MLQLLNISKIYKGAELVRALNCVSLSFRKSEFVSILGPSGCGKTTLLNIVGGLDTYDSGDLTINGLSTKKFKAADWDAYRNRSIGFVFQNYNLIMHQTVLQNVEIALTLSGVSSSEKRRRAVQALADVHLSDQIKKRPNQLSGGQMQRVAIARALVNNPDIILADEPTGALDSHTSVQVMEILKEIAKTRLVIMVTHNAELSQTYSNRIITLLDGEVCSDSNPVAPTETEETAQAKGKFKKTSMSLFTAILLSYRNLLTKRNRTMITAFAGSIGIVGVALVLALSSGLSTYMNNMQSVQLSGYPITIGTQPQSLDASSRNPMLDGTASTSLQEYPSTDTIYSYNRASDQTTHTNVLSSDYLSYIDKMVTALPGAASTIAYSRGVSMNVLAESGTSVVKYETSSSKRGIFGMGGNIYWQEMPNNKDFITSQYDLVGSGSRLPVAKDEVLLVVDAYNRLDEAFLEKIGYTADKTDYTYTDFLGKSILKLIPNDSWYTQNNSVFTQADPSQYDSLYKGNTGVSLKIVGILRPKANTSSSYFSEGIVYTTMLTDYMVDNAKASKIAVAQSNSNTNVLTNAPFASNTAKSAMLLSVGADTTPTGISIYPKDFTSKDSIKQYLDSYNTNKAQADKVIYSDMADTITSMTKTLLNTISLVLIGFASISLLVSTIMIGIITYISVIERTKEIGILRAVGARKKDISRVFNAETLIIGFAAGVLGIGISYLLSIPINMIVQHKVDITNIASLQPLSAAILVAGSMVLTLIAGSIPARIAAKKDPVAALRTE